MNDWNVGTVSHGTMRAEDLIPEFAYRLHQLEKLSNSPDEAMLFLVANAYAIDDYESDDAQDILEQLFEALDAHALPYMYFGSHPGDGSDYGFWLYEDFESEFDGLRVDDLADVPEGYEGEVLHVSDHGNPSLYAYASGTGVCIWSLV